MLHRGDFTRAENALLSSLALHQELGVAAVETAHVVNLLGEVARARGDLAQAVFYFGECMAMCPEFMWAQHNLGQILLCQGKMAEAETCFGHCLILARQEVNPLLLVSTLGGLAGIAGARHQPERAARLFGAAEKRIDSWEGELMSTDQADWDHHLAAACEQLDPAAWQAAWAEGRACDPDIAVAYALGETDPWLDAP